jgi:hypothetical protein
MIEPNQSAEPTGKARCIRRCGGTSTASWRCDGVVALDSARCDSTLSLTTFWVGVFSPAAERFINNRTSSGYQSFKSLFSEKFGSSDSHAERAWMQEYRVVLDRAGEIL